jgi:hypothetical protein
MESRKMLTILVLALGLMVIAGLAPLANAGAADLSKTEKARVYTVFFSLSADETSEILSALESKCEGVKFVGKETISYDGIDASTNPEIDIDDKKNNLVLQNIEDSKKDLDGLILFFGGFSDKRYMLTGLPTIIVDCSPSNPQIGFKNAVALGEKYGTRFITATYSTAGFSSDASQFVPGDIPTPLAGDILAEKIKLFNVIRKLKHAKLLTIQDYDRMNPIGLKGWHAVEGPLDDFDKTYPGRLKEYLGIDIVIARSKELIQEIEKVEKKEAERIADMWISEAKAVIGVAREDVIRTAELYIAYKKLMKKYDANAITPSSWALIPDGVIKAMPPLAEMELAKELIPVCCESLIDCLVTQMIVTYTTGRPGFAGDMLGGFPPAVPVSEIPKNMMVIGHCYGPINPHGNDRVPYTIRNHAYYELGWDTTDPRRAWRKDAQVRANKQLEKEHITLVAICVEWPIDEVVSMVKVNVYDKKIEVYTGRTVDGNYLYKDFNNRICRAKLPFSLDKPFRQLRRDRWGCHRVVFYGGHKRKIKDLAALIGFEVVE